jgi:hydroxymethylpyrimidine kinase/phosphomethylpyrimidine kinase
MTPRVALTIAGSDSGGGAGLQADLKAFAAHGVFGTSAVTAVTAQNTTAVLGVVAMDPSFVVAQIDAVLTDLSVAAVKTGMLATPETIAAVAEIARHRSFPNLVVDPVLVSSTGHPLLGEGGVEAYLERLIPRATVLTPNLREAAVLCGVDVASLDSTDAMAACAEQLRALGATWVVVKGGHLSRLEHAENDDALRSSPDVVAGPRGISVLQATRVPTANDHGTGCSLSASIAAGLALGRDPLSAIEEAKAYVGRALLGASGWRLGAGHGPIDHFGWTPAPDAIGRGAPS